MLNLHWCALCLSTLSLFLRSFTHLFLPDGGSYSAAGMDLKKGNASAIVSIIFVYGIAQFGWGANNLTALLSGNLDRIKIAIYIQFGLYAFMFIHSKFIWKYVKQFPMISPPIDGKLRPGPMMFLVECILLCVCVAVDICTY